MWKRQTDWRFTCLHHASFWTSSGETDREERQKQGKGAGKQCRKLLSLTGQVRQDTKHWLIFFFWKHAGITAQWTREIGECPASKYSPNQEELLAQDQLLQKTRFSSGLLSQQRKLTVKIVSFLSSAIYSERDYPCRPLHEKFGFFSSLWGPRKENPAGNLFSFQVEAKACFLSIIFGTMREMLMNLETSIKDRTKHSAVYCRFQLWSRLVCDQEHTKLVPNWRFWGRTAAAE